MTISRPYYIPGDGFVTPGDRSAPPPVTQEKINEKIILALTQTKEELAEIRRFNSQLIVYLLVALVALGLTWVPIFKISEQVQGLQNSSIPVAPR